MNPIDESRTKIKYCIELLELYLNDNNLSKLDIEISIGFIKSETHRLKNTGYRDSEPYQSLAIPSNTFASAMTVCKQRTTEFKELRDVNYISYKRCYSESNFRDIPLSTALILVSLAQYIYRINNPNKDGFLWLTKMHELGHLVDTVRYRDLLITSKKLRLPKDFCHPLSDFNSSHMAIISKIDERVDKLSLSESLNKSDWVGQYKTNTKFANNLDNIIDELLFKIT